MVLVLWLFGVMVGGEVEMLRRFCGDVDTGDSVVTTANEHCTLHSRITDNISWIHRILYFHPIWVSQIKSIYKKHAHTNTHIPIQLNISRLPPLHPRLNPISLPPSPNPPINLLPSHPIPDQTKRNPQLRLDIAIARLIVEEQHILVRNAARLVNLRKVLRLGTGENLHVVEVLERAHGACLAGGWVVREGRDDVQGFEHVAGEVGGEGARGEG